MLTLDGSQGEGGGQILRSALALSALTTTPFEIKRIRARRSKPGLLRQHLTAVLAAAEICGAEVDGARLGSGQLRFTPGKVRSGDYTFDIGTAGSTTLVLQTVLPPLLVADGPSTIHLRGGTHNPHAPPFEFLAESFAPLINRLGPRLTLTLKRPGFYPRGGGELTAHIEPAAKLTPFDLPPRGEIIERRATALVAGLPQSIGERELAVVAEKFGWDFDALRVDHLPHGAGVGNALSLKVSDGHIAEVVTGFGERGVRGETVADSACNELLTYLDSGASVGQRLADQLLIPLALSGGGSFITGPLTDHTKTNIATIGHFVDVTMSVTDVAPGLHRIAIF